MKIRITKIRPTAVIPTYGTVGAAAFDLTIDSDSLVPARGQGLAPTGLVIKVPDDHVLHIFARSSTFQKFGLLLSNGVGVIDADYCGPEDELKIMLFNPSDTAVTIPAGTRIAQGIIYPRPKVEFEEAQADGPSRNGFGSTG